MDERRGTRVRRSDRPDRNGASSGDPGARFDMAPPPDIDVATDRLGAVLLARRQGLGLKLEDVAEEVKIRADYLRALESESFDDLPTPQYARLFLKTYAERLGLNVSEAYALLDLCDYPGLERIPTASTLREGSSGPDSKSRTVPVGLIVASVVILIILAVVIVALMRGNGTPDDLGAKEGAVGSVPMAVDQEIEPEIIPSEPQRPEPMHLALTFDRDTWVVLAADDDTIVNSILYAGDSATATADKSFMLTLGHTDGVVASVNGHLLSPFRERASRLSGVTITADSVAAWLAPTAHSESDTVSGRTMFQDTTLSG